MDASRLVCAVGAVLALAVAVVQGVPVPAVPEAASAPAPALSVGSVMVLTGLEKLPAFNGKFALVVSPPNANGDVDVAVEGVDAVVAASHLAHAPAGVTLDNKGNLLQANIPHVGDVVTLENLEAEPAYNGRQATVVADMTPEGQYRLSVDGHELVVASSNLKIAAATTPSDAVPEEQPQQPAVAKFVATGPATVPLEEFEKLKAEHDQLKSALETKEEIARLKASNEALKETLKVHADLAASEERREHEREINALKLKQVESEAGHVIPTSEELQAMDKTQLKDTLRNLLLAKATGSFPTDPLSVAPKQEEGAVAQEAAPASTVAVSVALEHQEESKAPEAQNSAPEAQNSAPVPAEEVPQELPEVGLRVVLEGLPKRALNGETGVVVSVGSEIGVRLDKSKDVVSVSVGNLEPFVDLGP